MTEQTLGIRTGDRIQKDHDPHPLPASLQILYGGYIDEAGWAPPTEKPLEVAVADFRRLTSDDSADAWAFRNLTLTYNQLCAKSSDLEGLPLSILIDNADGPESVTQLHVLQHHELISPLRIQAVEMKADSLEAINNILRYVPEDVDVFFEVPMDPHLLSALQIIDRQVGIKTRTAGTELTPARGLAAFLQWRGPKKVTSGIHHPFTGVNPKSGRHEYGNVNVSVAGVAANIGYPGIDIEQVLREEDPAHFLFSDQGLSFLGDSMFEQASLDQIAAARREGLRAIGTCNATTIANGLKQVQIAR